jgi:hypothetical protein
METARTAPSSYPSEAGNGGHRQGDPNSADRLFSYSAMTECDEHDVKLLRVLTDRGSEFYRNPERHQYELYLAVEDIDH